MIIVISVLRFKSLVPVLFSFVILSCSDPVAPEYDYKDGLIYIDGMASTLPGVSEVKVNITVTEFGISKIVFVDDALVSYKNVNTGEQFNLALQENKYIPANDFVVNEGEVWEINVVLADGTQYKSLPETVFAPVEISEIIVNYDSELKFREASNTYEPGHTISVSFDDPPDEENYYYWRYRSLEKLAFCSICYGGIYVDGTCELTGTRGYYTYGCDEHCWQIRYNENVSIFSDEYTNGNTINDLTVAEILLFTKRNILVELQQFSLSPSAYEYYKTLKGIVDNNGSFNAPLPAALVGNIYNPNDSDEFVLGRFTATATTVKPIFIERIFIEGPTIEKVVVFVWDVRDVFAPCEEGLYRTSVRPDGWID